MFKIRTSKYRHVFCDAPKTEVGHHVVLSVVIFRDEVGAASWPLAEASNDALIKDGGAD